MILHKLRDLLLIIASLLIALLLVELVSRLYVGTAPPEPVSRWDFRRGNPPPYSDTTLYTEEFIMESMQSLEDIRPSPDNSHFRLGDFAGEFINVRESIRVTTDQRNDAANKVFIFGGSTVFSQAVHDRHTISSYLQRLVNDAGKRFNVYNYGVVSFVVHQQTALLKTLPISEGDIVIFYDGANDIAYPLDRNRLQGWMPGEDHAPRVVERIKRLSPLEKLISRLHFRFDNIAFFKILYVNMNRKHEAALGTPRDVFLSNLKAMEKNYINALLEANNYTLDNGGRFVHFLQPTIYSLKKKSSYEKSLIKHDFLIAHASEEAYTTGYAVLQKALNQLAANNTMEHFDLTDIFDKRAPGEEFFLDYVHVNHAANKVVAENIFESIFGQ